MEQFLTQMKQWGYREEDLPSNISQRITKLDKMVDEFNEAVESFENQGYTQEEIDAELEDEDNAIDALETQIVQMIQSWHENNVREKQQRQQQNQQAAAPPVPVQVQAKPDEKKGGDGIGWWIFGGITLVLTLGAVNVMKNK